MNRKHFLSSLLPIAGSLKMGGIGVLLAGKDFSQTDENLNIIPAYLQRGDTIGITCPAGYITRDEIEPAVAQINDWGMNIKTGETIGKRDYTFGGTDEERTRDLQQMLDDPCLKAIMCARGGYGSVRIIDRLNFGQFKNHPKWIIGFSDITVLHCHLNRNYGIASLHSKMCNSFPADISKAEPVQLQALLSIKLALTGEKMRYPVTPNGCNRVGVGEGTLIGGNLKTIETLAGTSSDIRTNGKILFVEDTGEYLYSIDRMFMNLKRTGKLANLKALIVGGFKIRPEDPGEEFGRTLYEIVLEKVMEFNYPVCFNFPVGHQKDNFALKCGVMHKLEVNLDSVNLSEV